MGRSWARGVTLALGLALSVVGAAGCATAAAQVEDDAQAQEPATRGATLAQLDAHAAQQAASLEQCYLDNVEPSADPQPAGEVTLTVGISGEGYVRSANAYTETLPEEMIQCFVDAATGWPPFPALADPSLHIMKQFHFVLTPTGQGTAKARFVAK